MQLLFVLVFHYLFFTQNEITSHFYFPFLVNAFNCTSVCRQPRATWRRTVARNSLNTVDFSDFYYLNLNVMQHLTLGTLHNNCSFVTFSHRKDFQLRRCRTTIRICRFISSILLSISDTVTLSSIAETLTAYLHYLASVTVRWPARLLIDRLLPCPKEESPMEIRNHRTSLIEISPTILMNYWIIFDTKCHLEILIFRDFLNQSLLDNYL